MIQEYLLLDENEKDKLKSYNPKGIEVKLFSAGKGECWYIQFFSDGDNEENARILSDVDEYIQLNYKVTVLDSGCSAYFNKRLYPLISKFEYKLRKFLYLISSINKDERTSAIISDIETKDFGTIFSSLFVDEKFMRKVKDEIKARNIDFFSKDEVVDYISSMEEKTLWDDQIGKSVVPTLRNNYNRVRAYRNSVMHSHLIGWDKFKETQKLFRTINFELDSALHDIEVVESKTPSRPSFNRAFESVLRAQEQLSSIYDTLRPSIEQMQQLSSLYVNNPEITKLQENLLKLSSEYLDSLQNKSIQKQIREITESYKVSPAMEILQAQQKSIEAIMFNIPPVLQEIQKLAKDWEVPRIDTPSEIINNDDDLKDASDINISSEDDKEGLK